MEEQKININLPEGITKLEVINREGAAEVLLPPKAPIKVKLSGVIGSPLEFLTKRGSDENQIPLLRSMVIVDRENVKITLVTNEHDEYQRGEIIGVLEQHPKFKEFGINQEKLWDPNGLGQYFKMNRAYFDNKAENMKLVTALKNFEANIQTKIEKQKSEKGEFKDNFSGTVSSNLPDAFFVNMPIFKGQKPIQIEVEFLASVNGSNIMFKLVSPGACQTFEEVRDTVIDEQIEAIKAKEPELLIIEI